MNIFYPTSSNTVIPKSIWGDDLKSIMSSELETLIDTIETKNPFVNNGYWNAPSWLLRDYRLSDDETPVYEARIYYHTNPSMPDWDTGFGLTPEEALKDVIKEYERRAENNGVQTYPLVERAIELDRERRMKKNGISI